MNINLHAVSDADAQSLSFSMTAGQAGDYTGAAPLLDNLPKAQWLLGDRGYDADCNRDALETKASSPASRTADRATSRSDTTIVASGAAAASRSCSLQSRKVMKKRINFIRKTALTVGNFTKSILYKPRRLINAANEEGL